MDMYPKFDPYDTIIAMDIKLGQLVEAHNQLAKEYEQHKKDFGVLLHSHQVNQQSIVQLTQNNSEIFKALNHCLEQIAILQKNPPIKGD